MKQNHAEVVFTNSNFPAIYADAESKGKNYVQAVLEQAKRQEFNTTEFLKA